jgi:3,4-dihydroxy-2-butanone 4-phosphate synthase
MAAHARELICMAIMNDCARQMNLLLMAAGNNTYPDMS